MAKFLSALLFFNLVIEPHTPGQLIMGFAVAYLLWNWHD